MIKDMLHHVYLSFLRHYEAGHSGRFCDCACRKCHRARQLELYLALTGQWTAREWEIEEN